MTQSVAEEIDAVKAKIESIQYRLRKGEAIEQADLDDLYEACQALGRRLSR